MVEWSMKSIYCDVCLQAMLDVHVTAPFKLIQAVTPLMREAAKQEQEQQGEAAPRSIINISSTSGTHGNAGQANYAAGKAAIVGLTKVSWCTEQCNECLGAFFTTT
jgi:3-oxoacyl-[acyl-carrier protein] reductase